MKNLQLIHDNNRTCSLCSLSRTRCNVVPGIGKANAKIFIIGEAPGEDEDKEGVPFYGRCGKLLTKLMIQAGLDRDECYITNTVCCRPPQNRTPSDEEIIACKGWLWSKLKEVNPKIIITLGKTPTRLLLKLKKNFKLGDYVGRGFNVSYIEGKIYPWYHPSFLLQHGRKHEMATISFFSKILGQS